MKHVLVLFKGIVEEGLKWAYLFPVDGFRMNRLID